MRVLVSLLVLAVGCGSASAQYVNGLPPGGLYEAFGEPDAYTPLPLDVAGYYRDKAAYPPHAYHGPRYPVYTYIDPTLKKVKTKDGLTMDQCTRESLADFALHCSVGFYEVPSPGQAWYQIYYGTPGAIVEASQAWQNGYGSGYWAAHPSGQRLLIGGTIKPQYGGGPAHSRNVKAFLKRGFFWWYGNHDLSRCVAYTAGNNCLSSPPMYPWTQAGRLKYGYGGIGVAEGGFLGQTFGWQPWLYRFQKGLNPQRLELYREEPVEDIGGDEPWDWEGGLYVAPQRAAEPAEPVLPPRARGDVRSYLICP